MLDCKTILSKLQDIKAKKDITIPSSDLRNFVSLGLVKETKRAFDSTQPSSKLRSLKNELSKITNDKTKLNIRIKDKELYNKKLTPRKLYRRDSEYRNMKKQYIELENKEKMLRTQFLNLVQATTDQRYSANVNNEPVHLTYKGRELLSTLNQRITRVSTMNIKEFLNEIDQIKSLFQNISKKANQILKRISPSYSNIDEIHLRFTAAGLAGRPGEVEQTIKFFHIAAKSLLKRMSWVKPVLLTLAEAITILAKNEKDLNKMLDDINTITESSWDLVIVEEEQIRAAAILLSVQGNLQKLIQATKTIADRYCDKMYEAAAFLTSINHSGSNITDNENEGTDIQNGVANSDIISKFLYFKDFLSSLPHNTKEHNLTAALLCSSGLPIEVILERFSLANQILNKFNGGSMEIPSAMIAVLPFEIQEAMDNVRLAAAAISANRMSLGGLENLSLGMKLFLNSSIRNLVVSDRDDGIRSIVSSSSKVRPAVLGAAGMAAVTPMVLDMGMLTFHEVSLHKIAVRDFHFHPVHVHYVYG